MKPDGALQAIGLDRVATDAVALVAAFRANGGRSFQDLSVSEARETYRRTCQANGLPSEDVASVRDVHVPVQGAEITMRVYRGARVLDTGAPAILFIHGGGWVVGDLETHDGICRFLANRTGCVVLAVDYRRSPEHRFPVPLDDCREALAFARSQAGPLGIDAARILLAGDSAGANMAAVLAQASEPETDGIVGQVLLYPVVDLATESPSYARVSEGFALTAASMRWFRGHYLARISDATDPRTSPSLADLRRPLPSLFIVTVGLDPLCDEGIDYAAQVARNGTRVVHHHLPQHMHGIFTSAGRIGTGRELLEEAVDFIRSLDPLKRDAG